MPEKVRRLQARYRAEESSAKAIKIIRLGLFPLLFVLAVIGLSTFSGRNPVHTVDGLRICPPDEFRVLSSGNRYTIWEYTGKEKKPSRLILDEEIMGDYAQKFATVDSVLAECYWMSEKEIFVNSQGVRMLRGVTMEKDSSRERRYYVEGDHTVFMLSMLEDERYYNLTDCEEAMQQVADKIRHQ